MSSSVKFGALILVLGLGLVFASADAAFCAAWAEGGVLGVEGRERADRRVERSGGWEGVGSLEGVEGRLRAVLVLVLVMVGLVVSGSC